MSQTYFIDSNSFKSVFVGANSLLLDCTNVYKIRTYAVSSEALFSLMVIYQMRREHRMFHVSMLSVLPVLISDCNTKYHGISATNRAHLKCTENTKSNNTSKLNHLKHKAVSLPAERCR